MALCACGCGEQVKPGRRFVRGHNTRVQNPAKRAWALPRPLDGERWEVTRLDGSRSVVVALDPSDSHLVEGVHWYPDAYGYLVRDVPGGPKERLHRVVLGAPSALDVDHEDRDRLNNRRSNLRLATRAQQRQNIPARGGTSAYRGVCWVPRRKRWMARYGRKPEFAAFFADEREAALAVWRWRVENLPLCKGEPCPV